ncbi:hypothetical protein J3459_007584 [Metarhizium acridum]|nr:hypothetical protein J3459_007584 [Metarhizium acridum]
MIFVRASKGQADAHLLHRLTKGRNWDKDGVVKLDTCCADIVSGRQCLKCQLGLVRSSLAPEPSWCPPSSGDEQHHRGRHKSSTQSRMNPGTAAILLVQWHCASFSPGCAGNRRRIAWNKAMDRGETRLPSPPRQFRAHLGL